MLLRVGGRVCVLQLVVGNAGEGQVFASAAQFKVGVSELAGVVGVEPGCKYDQVIVCREDEIGKAPFERLQDIIAQREGLEIDRVGVGIKNFDPVFRIAKSVFESVGVGGEDFVDDQGQGNGEIQGVRRVGILL